MTADPEAVLASKRNLKRGLEAEIDETYELIVQHAQGFRMDTNGMRLTILIEYLQKAGVLSEEQVLDYEIEVAEKIKEALAGPLVQLQEHLKSSSKLSVVKNPTVLIDKNGRPLSGN